MTVETALDRLVPGLVDIYGDRVERIMLYGSTARGTQDEDSHVDIAVIMRTR